MTTTSLDDQGEYRDFEAARQQEIIQNTRSLRSNNPKVRAEAVKRLGQLKAGPDLFLTFLDDTNASVRAEAAAALGIMDRQEVTAEVVDRLLAAIDDPSDRVCSSAIYALGKLQIQESIGQIADCLDDPNPYVLSAAIQALGRLGAQELGDRIAGFLEQDNIHVQLACIRALTMLGYTPAGPKIMRHIEANLHLDRQGKNGDMLVSAVQALGQLKVHEAIPLLIRLAQTEVGLRGKSVQALMALKAEEAAPVLAMMLSEPSNRLREELIWMMIDVGYTPALPLIRPMLKDETGYLRDAALLAVMKMGDPAAIKQVRWMCFHEPRPFTRIRAVECLVALTGQEAIPDLLALKDDLNTEVRRAVVTHLGKWEALPQPARAALATMAENDPDPEIADLASQGLANQALAEPSESGRIASVAPSPCLLPKELVPQVPSLLSALECWQSGLPELVRLQTPEQIAATDRALTHLIGILEEVGEG